MSWLFGYVGGLTPALRARFQRLHEAPLYGDAGPGHYLQAGGLPATCCQGVLKDAPGQWFVVGLGLDPAHHRVLDGTAWQRILSAPKPVLGALDGHFVAATVSGAAVHVYTDQLGTRTLHYASCGEGWVFSTRLDWLAALRGGLDIDYAAFGSHWITFNQLSSRSQVQGLTRLGPGGHLALCTHSRKASDHDWECEVGSADVNGGSFAQAVSGYCSPAGLGPASLGLSGGLDSRLLLALGARQTHTFGPSGHPDVRLARRIASSEGIPQHHLYAQDWDADAAIALLEARARTTPPVSAASSVLDLHHYEHLHQSGACIIDGGFGEVARRQFMNRLLHFGKGWGDPKDVLPHIRTARAQVFCREATDAMTGGALEDIACLRDRLPQKLDAENAVDLIGVRTRLPNFFGLEQSRLDGQAACFMPFAQPSVLRALFQLPLALRRNGRLFKKLIRTRRPSLARYPLIKGTTSYPFHFSTLGAQLLGRIKKKAGFAYRDPRPQAFLQAVKPWALDLVHSDGVRTYAAYDRVKLERVVLGYYQGNTAMAGALDWWLAFETWRRTLRT